MEEVNVGGNKRRKWYSGNVCCAVLRYISSAKFFVTSIASSDPETVQLPAFSILSVVFTGALTLPEKLSLALVPRSSVLRMIVKLAYEIEGKSLLVHCVHVIGACQSASVKHNQEEKNPHTFAHLVRTNVSAMFDNPKILLF